jgi:hypothetical protein
VTLNVLFTNVNPLAPIEDASVTDGGAYVQTSFAKPAFGGVTAPDRSDICTAMFPGTNGDDIDTVNTYNDPLPDRTLENVGPLDVTTKSFAVTPETGDENDAVTLTTVPANAEPFMPAELVTVAVGGAYTTTNGWEATFGGEMNPEPSITCAVMTPAAIGDETVTPNVYCKADAGDKNRLKTVLPATVTRKSLAVTPVTGLLNVAVNVNESVLIVEPLAPTDDVSTTVGGSYTTVNGGNAGIGGDILPAPAGMETE